MNTNLRPLSPFQDFCVKFLGYVPSSYDECMTYLECLIYTYNYLKNEIVPTVNTQNTVIQEMKDYIDNYFTNLDVQEEINNKLDQMATDGTLEEIITSYIQLKSLLVYDSVNDMKNADNVVNGSYAKTLGYYDKNDGGGAYFKIRTITNDDVIDETVIYEMNNDDSLIAELIIDETMNVKQFGVKADGLTDNTSKLNIILGLNKKCLYFPDGEYLVNNILTINNCMNIKGQSLKGTIIKAPNGFITWNQNNENRLISDLTIDGVEINNNTGIEGVFAFSKIENLHILNYDIAFKPLVGSWINSFDNMLINYCTNGIYNTSITTFNNNVFNKCSFQRITNDCINAIGDVNSFNGCNFELSHNCFHRVGRELKISDCYIENNDRIIEVDNPSFNSNVTISNCWLYSKGANATNGWIACLLSSSSVNTQTASLQIINSDIRNNVADTLKPISFQQSDGTKSYWGVSLENNSYFDITSAHSWTPYYVDLFDFTNASDYGKTTNIVTFYSDLPIYNYDGILAFRKTLGNKRSALNNNMLMELKGHYAIEKTAGLITITPDYKFCNLYPQQTITSAVVKFSDNSIQLCRMDVDSANFYVWVDYNGKTTSEIIFDCCYTKK